jgi:hypothetical protein
MRTELLRERYEPLEVVGEAARARSSARSITSTVATSR